MAGHGIASIFSSLFRAFRPVMKKAGKYAARKAGETGMKIASDIIHGDSLRNSFKRRLTDAQDEVVSDSLKNLQRVLRGNGSAKRRKITSSHAKNKRKVKKIRGRRKKNKKKTKSASQNKKKKGPKHLSTHHNIKYQKRVKSKELQHTHGDLF